VMLQENLCCHGLQDVTQTHPESVDEKSKLHERENEMVPDSRCPGGKHGDLTSDRCPLVDTARQRSQGLGQATETGSRYKAQAGLDLSASTSRVLGLQVCTTTPA
jgi:hypothetical protein